MKNNFKVQLLWLALLILPSVSLPVLCKPNTADSPFNVPELNAYLTRYRAKKENLSIFPEQIRTDSLAKTPDKKYGVVLFMFKSSDPRNDSSAAAFLNLWQKYKQHFNFVLIDIDKPVTYYGSLYLKDYWKDGALKVNVFSTSGKIRIELEDTADLPKLDQALYNLASELQSR